MIINLVPDASVASAPAGFVDAVQAAAAILDKTITNNITLNIAYGWGTYNNTASPDLAGADGAVGGYTRFQLFSYATVKSWLSANASSTADFSAVAALPANTTALPFPTQIVVTSSELKAFGLIQSNRPGLDGAIGFGTASAPTFWLPAALHELTHAMGRISGSNMVDLADLFRYAKPGTFQWDGGAPAYFSIDGGTTNLGSYSTVGDYGDFAEDDADDPFDAYLDGSNTGLSQVDKTAMDVIGFNVGAPLVVVSGQTDTVSGGMAICGALTSNGGSLVVTAGGKTVGAVVSSGGQQTVHGGIANRTTILDGGSVQVSDNARANGTQVSGGTLTLVSSGHSDHTVVFAGGSEIIEGKAKSLRTIVNSGGVQTILSGGLSMSATIRGGEQDVDGGNAYRTDILGSGFATVSAGGTTRAATVEDGGTLNVADGGVAWNTTVSNGGIASVMSGGSAQGIRVHSGGQIICAGGKIAGLSIDSGGSETIAAGVTASGLRLGNGTTLFVSSGATAASIAIDGGTAVIAAGGLVSGQVRLVGNATVCVADPSGLPVSIRGFDATDRLDLTGFAFSPTETAVFTPSASKGGGTLTITDGALQASVTLFGHFVATGFSLASDGAAGSVITYSDPESLSPALAPSLAAAPHHLTSG